MVVVGLMGCGERERGVEEGCVGVCYLLNVLVWRMGDGEQVRAVDVGLVGCGEWEKSRSTSSTVGDV